MSSRPKEIDPMEITEVRVRLVNGGTERLRAFCSITFDGDFVIRDLKIIEGTNGYFVAMPSRKLALRCGKCRAKNHLRARFCNECGAKQGERRAPRDASGRSKLHVDVAHPINTACRERIQQAVIEAFNGELERSQQPGYKPPALETDEDDYETTDYDDFVAELKESVGRRDTRRREEGELDASVRREDREPSRTSTEDFLNELTADEDSEVETSTSSDSWTPEPKPEPSPPRTAPPPRPAPPPRRDPPHESSGDFASGIF
jgi:stage V sporulation protein G